MSNSRRITSFFKRPKFALSAQEALVQPTENPAPGLRSSPPSDPPPSSLPSDTTSPHTPDGPALQLKHSLLLTTNDAASNDREQQESFLSAETGASFGSSQRVIKNGREVVISSDGDDTDSVESFESPEALLMSFTKPKDPGMDKTRMNNEAHKQGTTFRSGKPAKTAKYKTGVRIKTTVPVYKNTLNDLVMQANDDNKTEAEIAKLKAAFVQSDDSKDTRSRPNILHEGILSTALGGDEDDAQGIRRLLDAVRRTDAFDLGKSWSFFEDEGALPPAPEFPRDCIPPGRYVTFLREPDSRERAFHSGIVDLALSKEMLPNELITWIFYSVASEPRETLRHSYCRALKHVSAERIRSLVRPSDIDALFQQLGAKHVALSASETIIPDPQAKGEYSQTATQRHGALLSILELIREVGPFLQGDTQEHILNILLRLTLDVSLTRNSMICSELERSISAVFESIPKDVYEELTNRICSNTFAILRDPGLQSRLLQHILPKTDWVAALRRRLAIIFLSNDPASNSEPNDIIFELNRVTDILHNERFDVKRYKGTGRAKYDYGDLGSIVTFLDILIDSGWSGMKFSDRQAEKEFNKHVDILADRVKKIFISIEDSGASHLRRTLAKEALESLHYRIVYSVRTKPRPVKNVFGGTTSQSTLDSRFIKKRVQTLIPDE